MITVIGIPESDRRRVANAIVRTIGIGGVCDEFPPCPHCPGNEAHECAVTNHVKFLDYDENEKNA